MFQNVAYTAGLEERQSVLIDSSADLGVRYARVSGDWNPHHLWPWSARLLGYKSPIVHGMWTVARTLALLHSQGESGVTVSYKDAAKVIAKALGKLQQFVLFLDIK